VSPRPLGARQRPNSWRVEKKKPCGEKHGRENVEVVVDGTTDYTESMVTVDVGGTKFFLANDVSKTEIALEFTQESGKG
jgi:hypothetical protein